MKIEKNVWLVIEKRSWGVSCCPDEIIDSIFTTEEEALKRAEEINRSELFEDSDFRVERADEFITSY